MKALQPQLNNEDKDLMEKLLSTGHLEQKFAQRLQTVLLRARGKQAAGIAGFLGIHQSSVSAYINRYNALGLNSLPHDKTHKPGKEPVSQDIKNGICRLVCSEKPKGETHWSSRALARRTGVPHTRASRILREHGLKPHIASKRNYSNDPDFEKKLTDVVGLYLKPPENAAVWCIDEKSQIQALERSRPILNMLNPKTQKKIKKLTTNQRQLVPTVRHELVVRSLNHEFVVFVRFVVEKIGDKML